MFVKNDVIIHEWVVDRNEQGRVQRRQGDEQGHRLRGAAVLWFTPDGLVKQEHRYFDGATMMSQLGQMKAPARKPEAAPSGEAAWHVAKGTPEEDKLARAREDDLRLVREEGGSRLHRRHGTT